MSAETKRSDGVTRAMTDAEFAEYAESDLRDRLDFMDVFGEAKRARASESTLLSERDAAGAERDDLFRAIEAKDGALELALDKLRGHIESDYAGTTSWEPMMREVDEIERASADAGLRACSRPSSEGGTAK